MSKKFDLILEMNVMSDQIKALRKQQEIDSIKEQLEELRGFVNERCDGTMHRLAQVNATLNKISVEKLKIQIESQNQKIDRLEHFANEQHLRIQTLESEKRVWDLIVEAVNNLEPISDRFDKLEVSVEKLETIVQAIQFAERVVQRAQQIKEVNSCTD